MRGRHAPPPRIRVKPAVVRALLAAVIAAPIAAGGLGAIDQTPVARGEPADARAVRPPAPREPVRFTVVATGDILVHSTVSDRARMHARQGPFDFRPMFSAVRPLIRGADLAICHLETPLSPDGTDLSSYPMFNAPREVATAIRYAGYDACSTASNHSMDQGTAGIDATLDVLDAEGVVHAGTARTRWEGRRPTLLPVPGGEVALLSYTYGLNGLALPPSEPWRVGLIDAGGILEDARRAKRRGADLVIVSLHWGQEYRSEPTPIQQALARELLSSPRVDLILGHHAHVVQPIGRIGGKFVVFGMGNFLSGQSPACCRVGTDDGVIVEVVVEERDGAVKPVRVRYTPTWVEPGTYRILPAGGASDPAELSPQSLLALERSRQRSVSVVGRGNGIRPAGGSE